MEWITIATPPFGSIEKFDQVSAGKAPDGCVARYAGTVDGELRVIALWETKAHADRFFTETLGPVLAKTLGPEPSGMPKVEHVDVKRTYVA
ncbi:hypothetical protein Lesp02_05820 [Lentzea sp. NBRC 105346]|uniref:hypothetical protein n=1 Tax=Lentzea sp. NBRC 105346 TaxID=3032205 RepID=UPI0024A54627|nr:hypothetical protein [Lentzea sp. NBRC 105346]GLZ28392.1 hypothetical protein Lesp02_05820 [Lentzea sp. NBRC 105346]